jgi:hypothetical protein
VSVQAEPRFTRDVDVAVPDDNAAEGLVHSLLSKYRIDASIEQAVHWDAERATWAYTKPRGSREKRVFGYARVDVLGQRGKQTTVLAADMRPRLCHGLRSTGGHVYDGLRRYPGRIG